MIIIKFISSIKVKSDFSNLIQSVKAAKFNEEIIVMINSAINEHNKKEFPVVVEKPVHTNSNNHQEPNSNQIFIVHGHNEEIKLTVARLVEKLKLQPIILNEQANDGLTIIEKFEKYSKVSFAIILLTFDDFGDSKHSNLKNKRARQNVILELGYFYSKLGRGKVMILFEQDLELPSDILGILYTKLDDSGKWKFDLVKQLKSSGFNVTADDILH